MDFVVYSLAAVGFIFIVMVVVGLFVQRANARWDADYRAIRDKTDAYTAVLREKDIENDKNAADARRAVFAIFAGRDISVADASKPVALESALSALQSASDGMLQIFIREFTYSIVDANPPAIGSASILWHVALLSTACEILARQTKNRQKFIMVNGLQTKLLLLIWPNHWMIPDRL